LISTKQLILHMKKVLVTAFACDPTKGSEPGYGWHWASGLAASGYDVYCITRSEGRENIEKQAKIPHLTFIYLDLPLGMERLYSLSQPTMYVHYLSWQWLAYKRAKQLHKTSKFDIAHHVTWGSLQLGSFIYKLKVPFIFGPAGGGQAAPEAFKKYFGPHWASEKKREKVSAIFQRHNPACKDMVRKAKVVITSNPETYDLVKKMGGPNAGLLLDVALPESFFPDTLPVRTKGDNPELNLLWVGRFLPRKGIVLVMDVMNRLKAYPNIKLTVVGDGETAPEFKKAMDDMELHEQVNWVGKVPYDQVTKFYATHDIFLFTSLRDSGGLQLLEAMAYGLPIVTLDLHGQALIVDESRGIKCSIESVDIAITALADAIVSLYHDPARVTKLSENAFAYARQNTWSNRIADVIDKYYEN
jgi:glycosyltransferase involved in cell wall biosynthesis